MNGYQVNLIQTQQELNNLRKKHEQFKLTGVDTETTGLDFNNDHVVGLCVAFGKPIQGYYLPVRHKIGNNLSLNEVIDYAQWILDNRKTMLFNRNFDFQMLENEGVKIGWDIETHDVQPMCWMATNEGFPSLKQMCKDYLHFSMIEYNEAAGENNFDFGETDPEMSFVYAAFDPVATVVLGQYIWRTYPYIRKIYPIDNKVTEAVRRISQTQLTLDYDKLREFKEKEEVKLRELKAKAMAIAGYEFNPGSNREKGEALSRFVTLKVKTKKGDWSVKDEVLSDIDHPLAQVLLEYSKTRKFISSYLNVLLATEGYPVRINYKTVDVPTGRLASGKVVGNSYFSPFNIQSTPKTEFKRYVHPHPELGYYLNDDPNDAIAKKKVKAGCRDAFPAPEGYWLVTADYKAEELTIVANLSGETTFLDALISGRDIHMDTAKAVFGMENDESRGKVKVMNFATLYGATEFTLAKKLKVTVVQAKEMLNNYYKRLSRLSKWKDYIISQARKKGMVFTYYGRPRLLYKYYSSSEPGMKSFADRSAVNSIVQGPLTERSWILTDKGLIQISDILSDIRHDSTEPHPDLKVWNGEKWCRFGIYEHDVNTIRKVKLKNGYTVEAGKGHLFKAVCDEGIYDLSRDTLNVGDKILCSLPSKVEFESNGVDEIFYEFAGRFLGDGTIYDNSVKISCSLDEVDETYTHFSRKFKFGGICCQLKSEEKREELEKRGYTVYIDSNRKGNVAFFIEKTNGEAFKFLSLLGYKRGCVAKTKRISKLIFKSSLSQRAAFIKGFFDSDGCKIQSSFRWHMCQRPILEDLQLLLRTCGLRSILRDCSDGTFVLDVQDSKEFAELIGIEDKKRTARKYGRIQDNCIIPKFKAIEFINYYDNHIKNGYWKEIGLTEAQWKRDKAIVSKLRRGVSVGIDCYNSLCKSLKFDNLVFPYFYSEIKSIEEEAEGKTYCLSLWDESHQYEANGMIHHNCLPSDVMIELKDRAVVMSNVFLQEVELADGRKAIPSGRQTGLLVLLKSKTGDFCLTDSNHYLITGSRKHPFPVKVSEGVDEVLLGKLQPKLFPSLKLLTTKNVVSKLKMLVTRPEIKKTKEIYSLFFIAWAKNKKIVFDSPKSMVSFRSTASVFGFNAVLVGEKKFYDRGELKRKEYILKLKWTRRKKTKMNAFEILERGPIGSLTLRSGHQMYESQGFLNKNTGGDIMRILLIKLVDRYERDPEFRENVIIGWNVHDEINCYVKKEYLRKYYYLLRDMMRVFPPNWKAPLTSDIGVGTTWGDCLDIVGVTEDNKLIVPGINDHLYDEKGRLKQ